jgi:hypothetical protein
MATRKPRETTAAELAKLGTPSANPSWTKDQARLAAELTSFRRSRANLDPASAPSQTRPGKPAPQAPIYQRILGRKGK